MNHSVFEAPALVVTENAEGSTVVVAWREAFQHAAEMGGLPGRNARLQWVTARITPEMVTRLVDERPGESAAAVADWLFRGVVLDGWGRKPWGLADDWRATVALCRRLLRAMGDADSLACEKVQAARDVSLRHAGEAPSPPPLSPRVFEGLTADEQMHVRAQWLQFAADGQPASVAVRVWAAKTLTGSGLGWWRLRGAMGRALGAVGQWEEAGRLLDEAVTFWTSEAEWSELSVPLCERLRVAGLTGDAAGVEAREALALQAMQAMQALGARGGVGDYLRLALGRAFFQVGRVAEAADLLRPFGERANAAVHPHTAGLRWLGRASPDEAAQWRGRLRDEGMDDQALLAALDEVKARGGSSALQAEGGLKLLRELLETTVEGQAHRMQLAWRVGAGPEERVPLTALAGGVARYLEETRY